MSTLPFFSPLSLSPPFWAVGVIVFFFVCLFVSLTGPDFFLGHDF